MKILILTDHLTHQSTNSFYLVANSLLAHEEIKELFVASRSDETNEAFFNGEEMVVHVKKMTTPITFDEFKKWYGKDKVKVTDLKIFDFIHLRIPRPIHKNFFSFLTKQFEDRRIVNRPSGIIKTGSKAFLTQVAEFTAPIKMVSNIEEINKFKRQFPIVLKPLEDYGGRGIIKIEGDVVSLGNDKNLPFEEFSHQYIDEPQAYLAMKFLKNVSNGDKRIVVANGQILTASLRYPAKDSWLCNVAQGGHAELSKPTKDEFHIIEQITPILKKEGIFLYGLDTLEDDDGKRIISEINTLSVGGIAPAAEMSKTNLGQTYAELFVNFVGSI